MSRELRRVKLTGGNIRNHHFYLRDCSAVIPADGVGGANKDATGVPFTVRFEPGTTVETDVDGGKMILRNRAAIRDFFERSAAAEGDWVVLERTADRLIEVWLENAV